MSDPWRAKHFGAGYSAEWLPPGQRSWRILRHDGGRVHVFPTIRAAKEAAKNRFLEAVEPEIRATLPVDPDRVAEKLRAEAESWLKTSRQDAKTTAMIRKAGRRHVVVIRGRA